MNKLFPALAAIIAIASCDSYRGFELSVNITGLSDGTVYLEQRIDKAYIPVDSAQSTDGSFSFTGKVEIPDAYYLSIPGKRGRSMLFLENGKIKIRVHVDSLYYPEVSGSAVHDEYLQFQKSIDEVYDKMDHLQDEKQQAKQRGDTIIAGEIENQIRLLHEKLEENGIAYLDENPSSYISPFVVQSLHYEKEAEEIEGLLAKLDPALGSTTITGSLKRRVEMLKRVAIGKMAPDFTQNDPEGNPVSLSSLKGNYLLLDFWASWCGPCRRENPNIVTAYEKYHDKGFDVLGVSLDNSRERWMKAIQDDRLTWNHVSELNYWSNSAVPLYGISVIPSNLLLDPEGRIIAKKLKGKDLHDKLEQLLMP